jgi:UDP-N-acetylglucosamine--N-acetylmuramyl-(pentapeptide) pyrophosphoryl-undecaprenol N-acetylglucosamine transferase
MKVIISGGGTGGHIYPAIAIANALREKNSAVQILFVGASGRMEMQKVPASGYKIVGLPISGIQRRLTVQNVLFPYKVISSLWKSRSILKGFNADIAIGVGGYASWPLLYAASMMKIPTMIQEQNSYAGISNKFLSRKAKKICVAYEGMDAFFPQDKLVLTGNPVRRDILESGSKRSEALAFFNLREDKKTILIIGGSLGARTINESIGGHLEEFLREDIQVIWQTGKSYIEKSNRVAIKFNDPRIKVFPFIAEMNFAYAAADIVISRAGALSISELCLVAKPSIFVPSPNVAEDHQTKNALALTSRNAAHMVKDNEAFVKLVPEAIRLMKDVEQQKILAKNISRLGKPHAADDIADIVFDILKAKSKQ